MANVREFKKRISLICEELATDALIAQTLFPDKIDESRINAIINEIAALQDDTIVLTNFSFDKGRKQFENEKAYRRARHEYFKTAYKKLEKDFVERANEIIKQLNEAVPTEARKVVSNS